MPRGLAGLLVVMVASPTLLVNAIGAAAAQVDQGETEVVNIRETDERLGPLVFTLVGLGCAALVATLAFWLLTRPNRTNPAVAAERRHKIQGDG